MLLTQEASGTEVKVALTAVEEDVQCVAVCEGGVAAVTLPTVVDAVLQPWVNWHEGVASLAV